MSEWTIGAVLDAIADVIPDRPMTVCGDHGDTFELRDGGLVLSEDYTRFLAPGHDEVGWVARNGRIRSDTSMTPRPPARPSPRSTASAS